MTVMVESTASTQSAGAMTPPPLTERTKDDEHDPLWPLHEAHLAGADQCFGAGASVADHQRGDHDEGGEHHVEETVAARVEDQQAKEEDNIGVAVDDRVKERAEDGDLIGLPGNATVHHVEDACADDDQARVEEVADVVVAVRKAEEDGRDDVNDQADEGEDIGRDTGEGETVDDGL